MHNSKIKLTAFFALAILAVSMMGFNKENTQIVKLSKFSLLAPVIVGQSHKITKETTDLELERIKSQFKAEGVDLKFPNTKRNALNEIFSISIEFKKTERTFFEKWNFNTKSNTPIKPFYLKLENDLLIHASETRIWNTYNLNAPPADAQSKPSFVVFNDQKKTDSKNTKTAMSSEETQSAKRSRSIAPFNPIDSSEVKTIALVITKDASDAFLEKQKIDLKTYGIEAKFSKIERNDAGEITSLKITLNDNQGRKSSSIWNEKEQAIPDIVMGKSKDDTLFISPVEH
ncbi:hypothetical protein ESY86_16665 [Subsaximicrobium wynnwilliamsii]|uniref:Uncharacterized protein n=1 Tax=Subsaximicrobium wynnwilliamsii TaxID=291179 RepID=A0A5C6ZEG7_9FLAO|nr:hypothetical protein [Subsaximicrobium wynnwilliamsii]TXD81857.1 hypothetical protein ESY87_16565 [Subsaximicrobium wynnwilliamsii]TXD87526.1 hypothetical protein ESY86_16665 [Subsaximicrobium wynnwilliamsii]TXE01209.1 hypothetical protein ESY88_16915 [Subsaximicrobium wynnwilliamsii]